MGTSGPSDVGSSSETTLFEDYLFNPPKDLVCPITQTLFVEPIVNSAGQIYEKRAFIQYLENSPEAIDPLTREKLDADVIPSIHPVKGRALEYREQVTRKCVELASQKDSPHPLEYLHRAAELASDVDLQVPGLGKQTISMIMRTTSKSVNGTAILMSFAEDLLREGQQDNAANVYYALLQICEDKDQQPELLKCFILCWAEQMDDQEDYSLEKLMLFVENQKFFSWGEIVDIMFQAGIDKRLILSLCEELMNRDDPDNTLWVSQKEVMIKYIDIRCGEIEEQQGLHQKELQHLLEWKERAMKSGTLTRKRIPLAVLKERRKPFFLKKRFLASIVIACLELFEGGSNARIKILKTAATLYLLNSH